MSLPEHFVKDNLAKAEWATLYGTLITEMSREELIACTFAGWDGYRLALQQKVAELEHLSDLMGE